MAENGGHRGGVELRGQAVPLGKLLGRDQPAGGDALPEEVGGGERLPVGQPALGERAANLALGVEDVAVRVAKRALLDPELGVRYELSFFRTPEEAEEPPPVELARNRERGDAADDRLEDHRAGAGIQVCEQAAHVSIWRIAT